MRALLWVVFLAAVGIEICGPIHDPDLWWHITVGKWIIAHHAIPTTDLWNMFGVGQPWRAYSWANEILFAAVDARFGVHGLLAFQIALSAVIALAFGWAFRSIARDGFVGAALGAFAAAACVSHYSLRPQSFVWIYFALLLMTADRIASEGLNFRRGLAVVGLMCLWANTHITTALGVGSLALWLFVGRSSCGVAARVCGLAVLGTLCTPYLGGEWLTFFAKTGHPFQMQSIREFGPATITMPTTACLILLGALLAVFVHRKPTIIEPCKIVLVGGFSIAGLAVVKFTPFAIIVLCAVTALAWRRGAAEPEVLGNLGEGFRRLRKLIETLPNEGLAFLLICTMIVNVHNVWAEPLHRKLVPVDAVDFIQKHSLPHPILNDFGRGGYMMYRFSDSAGVLEHLVPIDGRTNVNPVDVWEKAHAAFAGQERWAEFRDLVKPETIIWTRESPFTSILTAENTWCVVMQTGSSDQGYVVFVKRDYFEAHPGEFSSPNCAAPAA